MPLCMRVFRLELDGQHAGILCGEQARHSGPSGRTKGGLARAVMGKPHTFRVHCNETLPPVLKTQRRDHWKSAGVQRMPAAAIPAEGVNIGGLALLGFPETRQDSTVHEPSCCNENRPPWNTAG